MALALLVCSGGAAAGEADVVAARAIAEPGGTYRFEVTMRHGDTGWDHYADAWQILTPDGKVIATRKLLHPHVGEQPFTRDLSGVDVPEGLTHVRVRGHDKVDGYGGTEMTIVLPGRESAT